MTNINFYVSKEEGWDSRLSIAYRLIALAQQHKLTIHIHTDNEKDSKSVDDFLWKHQKSSFIAHKIVFSHALDDEKKLIKNEISISHDYEPMDNCDYLINLSKARPDYFSRYLKLAEIIDSSADILTAGRLRYAFYRDRGYTLEYHQL